MPELGKATYDLVFNTQQFDARMSEAKAASAITTDAIDADMVAATAAIEHMGAATHVTATEMEAAFEEAGGAAMIASEEVAVASDTVIASTSAAAASTGRAAMATSAGWAKMTGAISRYSKMVLGVSALVFAYEGVKRFSSLQKSAALLNNAIQNTGNAAGVSAAYIDRLAQSIQNKTGIDREQIEMSAQLLLRFKRVHDEAGKGNNIFTRTLGIVNAVATATGKGLTPVTIGLGKALADPVKYLGMLGRMGITFTAQEKKMIIALAESGDLMGAQSKILDSLEGRYKKAGEAAAKSMGGQLSILKFALYDVAAAAVQKASPAIEHLAQRMSAWAQNALKPGTKQNKELTNTLHQLGVILKTVWAIIRGIITVIQFVVRLIGGWGNAVRLLALAWVAFKALKLITYLATLQASIAAASASTGLLAAGLSKLGTLGVISIGVLITYEIAKHIPGISAAGKWIGKQVAQATGQTAPQGQQWEDVRANTQAVRDAYDQARARGLSDKQAIAAVQRQFPERPVEKALSPSQRAKNPGGTKQIVMRNGRWTDTATGKPLEGAERGHAIRTWMNSRPKGREGEQPREGSVVTVGPIANVAVPTVPPAAHAKGQAGKAGPLVLKGHLLPYEMEVAQARAERTKKTSDDLKVLREEEAYLQGLLKKKNISKDKRLAIEQAITQVDQQIASITDKSRTPKPEKPLIGLDIQLALVKAAGTKRTSDDLKALGTEEDYLKGLLKNKHLSMAKRIEISQELNAVREQMASINAEIAAKELAGEQKAALKLIPRRVTAAVKAAARTAGLADDRATLLSEENFIKHLLLNRKLSVAKRRVLKNALDSVMAQLRDVNDAIRASIVGGEIPAALRIALAQAQRTASLEDDIAALKAEESYLEQLLKNMKLTLEERAGLEEQLTGIINQIQGMQDQIAADAKTAVGATKDLGSAAVSSADDLKKAADEARRAALAQMRTFMDLRGSFFSQFAGNIFGQSVLGLTLNPGPNVGSKTLTYQQHNTFNEIPRDRYQLSRQMRQVAASAMDG